MNKGIYKICSREFKEAAVLQVLRGDRSPAEVAESLGIKLRSLNSWCRIYSKTNGRLGALLSQPIVLNGVWNDEMIVDAIKHEALAYYHEDPDRFPLTVTTSPENVNPDSLDLCLGNQIRLPMWYWRNSITRGIAHLIEKARPGSTQMWEKDTRVFDTYTLWPGQFVLCHSKETMQVPDDAVAMLFSKSSTGRTGLEHLHAGLGDSGFKGEWTWEFTNTAPWPITLVAGKRLMQVIFISMAKEPGMVYSKTGRYQGQSGPTAARN